MTDDQVEKFILKQLKKKEVCYWDMKFGPGHGIDENPEDHITPLCEKGIRSNRFESYMGCDRMRELLCVGKYNQYDETIRLKIPFQDLFRFWWDRCVIQEYVVDDVLEEIFEYFTELLAPPREKEEEPDVTIDFEQISLFTPSLEKAA
jgi:hypothetical protein